eukprot:TRINITY_DN4387_c0_g1_i2.p1 TRINITY_DN4387_c0_g1~~TRINITY_DN4387_c0_g1_i2.p1  ORF type:complete len:613 (-),score=137.90 TRINITY_DN4387_c0_g1_i2:607-2445(-)
MAATALAGAAVTGVGKGKGKGPPPPGSTGSVEGKGQSGQTSSGKDDMQPAKGGYAALQGKGKAPSAPPPPGAEKGGKHSKNGKSGKGANAVANPGETFQKPLHYLDGLMMIVGLQQEDGHFDIDQVAAVLEEKSTTYDHARDLAREFRSLGSASAVTKFMLLLWDYAVTEVTKSTSAVQLQSVGDGRGSSEKVMETAAVNEADAQERVESIHRVIVSFKPACGEEWRAKAAEWLQAHAGSEDQVLKEACQVDAIIQKYCTSAASKKPPQRGRMSQEERARREEAQRLKDEQVKERQRLIVAHWQRLKGRSVDSVPWKDAKKCRWCHGGTGGAFLLQIGESEAVVLKPQGALAVAESLANSVAKLVGVRVAESRSVTVAQDEYFEIASALKTCDYDEEDHRLNALLVGASTDKTSVAVLEFVPGVVMQGVDAHNMLKDPELAEILIPQVGAIIALDALLNNVDRMPALWANDGNFSNVMLAPDGKKALGIDQQVNAITDATGRDRYFATVREFCQDAHHARLSCSNLSRLKEAFVVNTGIELTEDNIRSLLRGAEDVFARVRAESSTLKTSIRKLGSEMIALFGDASFDVGLTRLDCMLEFLEACVDAVSTAV